MEINVFGYAIRFGRPRQQPDRQTEQNFFGAFPIGITKAKQTQKKPNAEILRKFANTSVPRRAINIVKDGVLGLPFEFRKVNPNDETDYRQAIKILTNIIRNPNDTDTYRSFWGALLEDSLVGDNGSGEIVRTGRADKPLYIFPVDGFTMEFVEGWVGQPHYPRFAQTQGYTKKNYFMDSDILYLKKNSFTHVPWGLSPLETAFRYVDYLLNAQTYANSVTGKGLPKFILSLGENVNETQIEAFRRYLVNDIYGTGNLPVVGGTKGVQALQIGAINDDGLYLAWQHFLITIIAFTFGVDPKKLGEGSATDRSTVEEQNANNLYEAIKPYAEVLADVINKKILGQLGLDGVLEFRFIYAESLEQQKTRQDIAVAKFQADAITQSELRAELGYTPLKSKYGEMTISEMKSAINKDYMPEQNAGGFNGVGKDRKADTPKKGDNNNE